MEDEIRLLLLHLYFFTDTILLAINNILKGKFSDGEKRILERASHFIETVIQGKWCVDNLKLGMEATWSYGMALKALRKLNKAGNLFLIFTEYANLLREIRRNNKKEIDNKLSSKIENIKAFFRALKIIAREELHEKDTLEFYENVKVRGEF